jgi:5'-AMP-activated protein kinase catalytic alpha subunit
LPFDDENIRALFRKIKNGIYTIPPHVSSGARNLIQRMLMVRPLDRISVADVMKHPWYTTNLPAYLALSAEQLIEQNNAIDETTLQKVIQMGYSRDRILKALAMGHELLTSRKFAHYTEYRRVAVIYHLLRDSKRRTEQERVEIMSSLHAFQNSLNGSTAVTGPSTIDPPVDLTKMSAVAAKTYHELQQISETQQQNPTNLLGGALGGRWQLGQCSREDPQRIMTQVYSILKKYNFEWKVLSLYRVKARYPAGADGRTISASEVIKIGIQLFKASPPEPQPSISSPSSESSSSPHPINSPTDITPLNDFVLDITKLYGQMSLFLDLSSLIIHELQHSGTCT